MTKSAIQVLGIILLAYLIGACTKVGHIQRNDPVRMMTFPGSPQDAAQCAQQRLAAKTKMEGIERVVVYSSARSMQSQGFTHYSVTFGKAGEKGGFAEMRVERAVASPGPGQPTAGPVPLSQSAVDQLWKTVQDCAAQIKP